MECGQLNAIKNIKELQLGMVEIPAIRMVMTGGWFMVYDWVYYMIKICHQPVEGNYMIK